MIIASIYAWLVQILQFSFLSFELDRGWILTLLPYAADMAMQQLLAFILKAQLTTAASNSNLPSTLCFDVADEETPCK